MKKLLCLMLMITIFFSISAFAEEEFTLHSGTKFGMSVDEVENAEKINGFSAESFNEEEAWALATGRETKNLPPDQTSVTGSIAGIENASIDYYYFENELFLANYNLGHARKKNTDEIEQLKSDYEKISESLQLKYGSTEYNWLTNKKFDLPGSYHEQITSAFGQQEWYIEWYKMMKIDDPGVTIDKYEQWVVMLEDGSGVFIDHCLWWLNNLECYHDIFYTHFDKEIIQIDSNQQQQRMNDL